jgi:glycosyltransferase involved in cell wall biosynthesis
VYRHRITIVINNHNYGRYLDAAIDSALAQTGVSTEVVVVDDGSDDDSVERITRRGSAVRAVLQPNAGQKAAFNAGFAAATGDVVIFLDADDVLLPGTAAAVADAFQADARVVRVVYRLAVIDAGGRPTGALVPPARQPLPRGDVRPRLMAYPDDTPWPPTSGNAFAAWALAQVLPLPLDDERTGADHDLHTLIPMFGMVAALDNPGGHYRVHGDNAHARDGVDVERSRRIVRRSLRSHAELACLCNQLAYPRPRPRSVTIAAHRLISLRWGHDDAHPIAGDGVWRALVDGVRGAAGRHDVSAIRRLLFAAWCVGVALGPRRVAEHLVERGLQSTGSSPDA